MGLSWQLIAGSGQASRGRPLSEDSAHCWYGGAWNGCPLLLLMRAAVSSLPDMVVEWPEGWSSCPLLPLQRTAGVSSPSGEIVECLVGLSGCPLVPLQRTAGVSSPSGEINEGPVGWFGCPIIAPLGPGVSLP